MATTAIMKRKPGYEYIILEDTTCPRMLDISFRHYILYGSKLISFGKYTKFTRSLRDRTAKKKKLNKDTYFQHAETF